MAADAQSAAQAMAAKLSAIVGVKRSAPGSDFGPGGSANKRPFGGAGASNEILREIQVPEDRSVNWPGIIIGTGGSTHRHLQALTGCRIALKGRGSSRSGNDDNPERPLYIEIRGDDEDKVQKAHDHMYDIVYNPAARDALKEEQRQGYPSTGGDPGAPSGGQTGGQTGGFNGQGSSQMGGGGGGRDGGNSKPPNQCGPDDKEHWIPDNMVGLIIGRGGAMIQQLQNETGAHINIDSTGQGQPPMRRIVISGEPASIDRAIGDINKLLDQQIMRNQQRGGGGQQQGGGRGGGGGGPKEMHPIPGSTVGAIIGRGGAMIKQLMADSGCHIQINRESEGQQTRYVELSGAPESVARAKQDIDALVARVSRPNSGYGGGQNGQQRGGGGQQQQHQQQQGGGRGGGQAQYQPGQDDWANQHQQAAFQQLTGQQAGYNYQPQQQQQQQQQQQWSQQGAPAAVATQYPGWQWDGTQWVPDPSTAQADPNQAAAAQQQQQLQQQTSAQNVAGPTTNPDPAAASSSTQQEGSQCSSMEEYDEKMRLYNQQMEDYNRQMAAFQSTQGDK